LYVYQKTTSGDIARQDNTSFLPRRLNQATNWPVNIENIMAKTEHNTIRIMGSKV